MADSFKKKMIMKGASTLVDLGINQYNKMQEAPKTAATEAPTGSFLADKATGLLDKVFSTTGETKVSTVKGAVPKEETEVVNPLDSAFANLSSIAGSLEEADTHKMIEDIIFLVRTGRKVPEAELTNWVFRLYGRNA